MFTFSSDLEKDEMKRRGYRSRSHVDAEDVHQHTWMVQVDSQVVRAL